MNWLVKPNVCPGLFYGTPAQDGFLIRIRTPGGWLNSQQGKAIATLLEQWNSKLQVTNRANLQIRAVQKSPTLEDFQTLQKLGLAASNPRIDHLRNIMCSPTAGIDCQELIDPRLLVQKLDNFIQNHPSIAELSPKFSIGIDSGGAVGIGSRSTIAWEHRYNEIQLSAIALENQPNLTSGIYFRLALGGDKQLYDTNLVIEPENCLSVVAALVTVYLDYVKQNPSVNGKKTRMKHLLKDWGIEKYLEQVNWQLEHPAQKSGFSEINRVSTPLPTLTTQPYSHLGIHAQKQAGLSYIGLGLRLGQLTAAQLLGLVQLSETFGSSQLRLTPWQTILLPDIQNEKVSDLLPKLTSLGLSISSRSDAAIVACAGKPGCAAAATQTQIHALILADYLNDRLTLKSPVNIHLTGCAKSCAQASPAEITLLGTTIEQNGERVEGYQVYVGDEKESLKYQIFEGSFADIPFMIEQFLRQPNGVENPSINLGRRQLI
ncbi:precorrin-3B synthase [Argonema antarcticum]|uniref:precorrin-3B synthase n=1 Tax=Argonema antarcticum TaxID=2942763 RepID=UPI00201373DC|nr:precorrin-3B synthase [Argonema antarcticum A004/B2]